MNSKRSENKETGKMRRVEKGRSVGGENGGGEGKDGNEQKTGGRKGRPQKRSSMIKSNKKSRQIICCWKDPFRCSCRRYSRERV